MIIVLDTDVLVHWLMAGAPHHRVVRAWVEQEIAERESQLGLTAQVVCELVHVVSDERRFATPMPMSDAIARARDLWVAPEVVRLMPGPECMLRTLSLLRQHQLGRKRVLDTMLAATIETAGLTRLATLNERDYRVFSFLELINPRHP